MLLEYDTTEHLHLPQTLGVGGNISTGRLTQNTVQCCVVLAAIDDVPHITHVECVGVVCLCLCAV